MEQRTRVGVECPVCHWRNFYEMEVDESLLKSPVAAEIRGHLEDWVASRCPDHLEPYLKVTKN